MVLAILCICDSYDVDTSFAMSLGMKHVELRKCNYKSAFLLSHSNSITKKLPALQMKSTPRIEGRAVQ